MSALVEWRVTCTPGEARCAPLALARSVENLYEQYTVRAAVESKARCASAERAARSGPGKERPGRGPPRRAACEGRAGAAVPACVPTERTMPPGSPPPHQAEVRLVNPPKWLASVELEWVRTDPYFAPLLSGLKVCPRSNPRPRPNPSPSPNSDSQPSPFTLALPLPLTHPSSSPSP